MIAAVLGLQFGDEGKGKITDFLSGMFQVSVRFNGGGNAGHTVVANGKTYKFHLIPSGSLRCETVVLGNGMVIDPHGLADEMDKLTASGCSSHIIISKMAHVVTPMHKILDTKEESVRSKLSIGTTAQGIGPTYEDKYARTGIRMADLYSRESMTQKVKVLLALKGHLLEGTDLSSESSSSKMIDDLYRAGQELSRYICDTSSKLAELDAAGQELLFESSHGTLLDIDHGMYPYVTSSNTLAGSISTAAGFSFRRIKNVIGVVKAYTSKVGSGNFPSEITGPEAERLRKEGNEFGTTTGRPRRVGWLDLKLLNYAVRLNDVDYLALTRIDTLGAFDNVKVIVDYDCEDVCNPPQNPENVQYQEFKSWGKLERDKILEMTKHGFSALPDSLADYIDFIEHSVKRKINIVSFGNTRNLTLNRSPVVGL